MPADGITLGSSLDPLVPQRASRFEGGRLATSLAVARALVAGAKCRTERDTSPRHRRRAPDTGTRLIDRLSRLGLAGRESNVVSPFCCRRLPTKRIAVLDDRNRPEHLAA